MKAKGKNGVLLKHVLKGCDLYCEGTGELVTCPYCKKFQFHMDCLQKILHSLGKPGVDPATTWKCVHCGFKFCAKISSLCKAKFLKLFTRITTLNLYFQCKVLLIDISAMKN